MNIYLHCIACVDSVETGEAYKCSASDAPLPINCTPKIYVCIMFFFELLHSMDDKVYGRCPKFHHWPASAQIDTALHCTHTLASPGSPFLSFADNKNRWTHRIGEQNRFCTISLRIDGHFMRDVVSAWNRTGNMISQLFHRVFLRVRSIQICSTRFCVFVFESFPAVRYALTQMTSIPRRSDRFARMPLWLLPKLPN